jgi:non-specific serine/threonine protein kinase
VSRSFVERLVSALSPRRALLLVDNCEHLLDSTADLADALLAGGPHLVLLATSREALGVEGEQVVQVPSLAVPDESAPDAVTDAAYVEIATMRRSRTDRLAAGGRPARHRDLCST